MTEKKPRSSFLPVLFLVVVATVLVLAFVPMVECDVCIGVGQWTGREFGTASHDVDTIPYYGVPANYDPDEPEPPCPWCKGKARIPVYKKSVMEKPEDIKAMQADNAWIFQRIVKNRHSIP